VELHTLDRENLRHENGVYAQRLLPWQALNAPFEGSWCVIRPGTNSMPHEHHEHEIFIALSGEATVTADGEERPFVEGDVAYFPPGVKHHVTNRSERDFQMYSVWWDREMTDRFVARVDGTN
jgi:mannose-6-phosphate isomerase-like protein (cupin superfamily)